MIHLMSYGGWIALIKDYLSQILSINSLITEPWSGRLNMRIRQRGWMNHGYRSVRIPIELEKMCRARPKSFINRPAWMKWSQLHRDGAQRCVNFVCGESLPNVNEAGLELRELFFYV